MVYSDTTYDQGIIQEIDFNCNSNSNTYSIEDKTRNVNRWLDHVQFLITKADGRWQYDDVNKTDLPIATTDLVNGQQDYSLDPSQIEVIRIEAKDTAGTYNLVLPMDARDVQDLALSEFLANGGVPRFYDMTGNSIFLYPAPNYNSTAGLKLYYKRNVSYFTTQDTDKEPGFAPQFHRILALGASRDYCVKNKDLNYKVPLLDNQIARIEDAIIKFYNRREKDENIRLGIRTRVWR